MPRRSFALTFCGGAGTVTGSKYLVSVGEQQVLLDCGLFQGLKPLRLRNWQEPPFEARAIDAVVLSHAHLDHCGYLPVLVRRGFRGRVFCTPATAGLLRVVLLDCARVQEEDAEAANRGGYSKHRPALPLFTVDEARRALGCVVMRPYGQPVPLGEEISVRFHRAGHILGSSIVELHLGGREPLRLVFSGDLGRWDQPILRDPERVETADLLLLESTYGDRVHSPDPGSELARIVNEAVGRGGVLIVPSFAIGRTQQLIWWLRELERQGRIPSLPVFLDSPMAAQTGELYDRHREEHDAEMRQLIERERTLRTARLHIVDSARESRALDRYDRPYMIIAGSGMATGGRVLHHLKAHLPDERTTMVLVGYQAAGTRGRLLQEGAASVKIHGEQVPVRAAIRTLEGLSAHADREEILRWLSGFAQPPRVTYLVHGEPPQAQALAETIRARLGWTVHVAQDGGQVEVPAVNGPVSEVPNASQLGKNI